jgi:hypothetical protein
MKYKFSGVPLIHHHDSDPASSQQKAALVLLALTAVTGVAIVMNTGSRDAEQVNTLQPALGVVNSIANNIALSQVKPIEMAVPGGWRTNQVATGAVAYAMPADEVETVEPEVAAQNAIASLDGTRFPYVSEVNTKDLMANPIAPGVYQWTDTWQGEGYSREYNRQGNLVSEREGGTDIDVTVVYDSNVKDPTKPNLMIMVQNNQDETGQLTNLSAFLNDPVTGKAIARQDFEQLPPVYDVVLTKNGGFGGVETKTLDRLGTVTFSYHVSADELKKNLPIKLQGNNAYFDERQQEFYNLQAQGWVIKEVPAAR